MLLKEINPFVRKAIIATLTHNTKNDVFTPLQTPDCRLFYITDGIGKMIIEDKAYPLKPGCAILFQSGTKYIWQVEDQKGVTYISVNFDYTMHFSHLTASYHPIHAEFFSDDNILEHISFTDAEVLNRPIYLKDAAVIESRMRLLASEYYLGNDYITELLSSCLKSILIHIVRTVNAGTDSVKDQSYDTARKVIQYIQNNYHSDLNNESIAAHFHINASYLNRIFKQHTGSTIHHFLVQYRMNLAMDLLRTGNDPVQEIVSTVGFSDIPHFMKSFKKLTGKTPSEYRHTQ